MIGNNCFQTLIMASAALAQSSYRIAKSWQYQEKLPDASSEDLSIEDNNAKLSKAYQNMQGNEIQPNSFPVYPLCNIRGV